MCCTSRTPALFGFKPSKAVIAIGCGVLSWVAALLFIAGIALLAQAAFGAIPYN